MKLLVAITAGLSLLGGSIASADPSNVRVLTAPTAWLPAEHTLTGTAGIDARDLKAGMIVVGYGLGGIAAVELGGDTDIRMCAAPPCADTPNDNLWLGRAAFRMGAHQDAWFRGQPALAFAVRTTFSSEAGSNTARVAQADIAASRELGPVKLHAGASLIDAGTRTTSMPARVKPFGAFELTPPQYPKTTLMLDFAWLPKFQPTEPVLEYVFGWGVRYQALAWGSIELDVRHREDEFSNPTVLVRVNGVWGSQTVRSTGTKR